MEPARRVVRALVAGWVIASAVCFGPLVAAPQGDNWSEGPKRLAKRVRPQVVGIAISERFRPTEGSGVTVAFEKRSLVALSGIVWSRDGLVVTLLRGGLPQPIHPDGEVQLEVELFDGSLHAASLVATDGYTGVTLIRMDDPPKTLRPRRIARTWDEGLEIGSTVLALGHETIHTGLVTHLRQRVEIRAEGFAFPRAIRTNIEMRGGNVGGLLCDTHGNLIGMLAFELDPDRAAIGPPAGTHANLGSVETSGLRGDVLAIPADLLSLICAELTRCGSVDRGAIGIRFRPASFSQLCIGDPQRHAAVITWVHPDGPAARAGLRVGHVVVGAKDRVFRSYEDLSWFTEIVEYGTIGERLTFSYFEYDPARPSLNDVRVGTATIASRTALAPTDSEGGGRDASDRGAPEPAKKPGGP
ncbi:MAG: serine protease [Planctomycetes bacterium]|nr:serine protease [Planctomycetota bacterium]